MPQEIVVPGDSGNPDVDVNVLVKDLYGTSIPAQSSASQTVQDTDPTEESQTRQPSMAAYLQEVQTKEGTIVKTNPYSENLNTAELARSINPASLMKSKFLNLKDKTPEERAKIGGQMGGGVGMAMNGMVGGLIGAGMGAMAARASGQIQSGQHEDGVRRNKMYETMGTVGIADSEGKITFDDGASFPLVNNPSVKLANVSAMSTGEKARDTYKIDKSNPLTKRTVEVAKPVAYMLSAGLMRWNNAKNPRDVNALESTTGTLVNALQTDAKDINLVYDRARQLVNKGKISKESMANYFRSIKHTLSEKEVEEIERGIDTLYA